MRSAIRRSRSEGEEESVFVSMTDMTVSFLLILMVLLAFFASQFNPEKMVPKTQLDEAIVERDRANQERDEYQNLVIEQAAEIAWLKANMVPKEQLITSLRERRELEFIVARQEEEIRRFNQDYVPRSVLLEVQNELASTKATIIAQATRIQSLQEELNRLKTRIRELENSALEKYAKAADAEREKLIKELKKKVKEAIPDVQVTISESGDILRFSGDSFFKKDSFKITDDKIKDVIQALAGGLESLLPCFTVGTNSRWSSSCNPNAVIVDAVQIEGHTDSDGDDKKNLLLSLKRGFTTFLEMRAHRPVLLTYKNISDDPVLSVSGYGEMRPFVANTSRINKGLNRRIDLRLIMASAGDPQEIVNIRNKLEETVSAVYLEGE